LINWRTIRVRCLGEGSRCCAPWRTLAATRFLLLLLVVLSCTAPAQALSQGAELKGESLLKEVEKRAFQFFWEQTDPITGLTKDRAHNTGDPDNYTVASTAGTGYGLASLPIGVKNGWIERGTAYTRALTTLRFVKSHLTNTHGWYYHFVDIHSGERVWNCEASTIDTTLLVEGALIAGRFWHGTEVERVANELNDQLDWDWMRTDGGASANKLLVCMGWTPESGFLKNNWDRYCELLQLYLLGLGSSTHPLPAASWTAWQRNPITYHGMDTLAGGPIFFHEMSHGFFNFKGYRDTDGWDYWISARNGVLINRQYCIDLSVSSPDSNRKSAYGANLWGINANDAPPPIGYHAYSAPGDEDGTLSPTGAIAAIIVAPTEATAATDTLYLTLKDRCWGKYGFGDAFNLSRNWFDSDVLGIDLGMAMLSIEDARTGLPWKLLSAHPGVARAWKAAGFHKVTNEKGASALQRTGVP